MFPSTTAIRRTVAPVVLPVTLTELDAQTRMDGTDDTVLTRLLAVAVEHVDGDGILGRAMITQTWAQWVPQSPGYVRLFMTPFQALVSVEYYDADGVLQTADLADYETRLSGDFVLVKPKENSAWPNTENRLDAIKITYTAGYGDTADDVPQGVRHAILMLAAHLYENREATTDVALRDTPMAVEALLNRERVAWYG